ncbi:MAG: histidine phosphatase family protein [Acidiferrobacter sp.]
MTIATIILVRHGTTAWSLAGQHTSVTDVALTAEGAAEARRVGALLAYERFDAIYTSPLRRAQDTAILAGFRQAQTEPDLSEWRYGTYEGQTTAEIHQADPDWSIFRCGAPDGESPPQVVERCDRLLARWTTTGHARILCFSHGHFLRALATRWIQQAIVLGDHLDLGPGSVSRLGWLHQARVLQLWNYCPPGEPGAAKTA